jgi:signal transduction histidine kinase
VIALSCIAPTQASAAADKDKDKKEKPREGQSIDAGSFGVFMSGHRVGTEKFSIDQANTGSMIKSEFKTENDPNLAVQDSVLELTAGGDIRRYEWKEVSPG